MISNKLPLFRKFVSILLSTLGIFFLQSPAEGKLPRTAPQSTSEAQIKILDWLAFGSGCKSSKDKPSNDVKIKHTTGDSYQAIVEFERLELNLATKPSGLSECAIRISIQPKPGTRIANIVARTKIVALKDSASHLRSHVLLLIGENTVSAHSWNLKPEDFARNRDEAIILSAGSSSQFPMPRMTCGQPQIIGLDLTLEGKKINSPEAKGEPFRNQETWLRAGGKNVPEAAKIDVYFEKCSS